MSPSSRLFFAVLSWAAAGGIVNALRQCMFSDPVRVYSGNTGEVFMQQVKDSSTGTFSMKWTYTGDQAWIGVGINSAGRAKMTPATAVIGRVESDGISTSVQYYSLTSDAEDASGVQPFSSSTIRNAVFEQPDESTSILTFTQDLSEMAVSDSSTWIFAVGLPGNQFAGKHVIDGSFQMGLTENCMEVADPTLSPTVQVTINADSPTVVVSTDPDEESPSVAAAPTSPIPSPTLAPVSSSVAGLSNGGDASASSGIVFLETNEYGNLWMAHGVIMAIAWGVCAPLGIGASILRDFIKEKFGRSWYNFHLYLNMMTLLLTVIGFLIAVVAMEKSGEHHFTENIHTRAGLTIMVLVVVQALAGYFRPAATPSAPAPSNTTKRSSQSDEELADDAEEAQEVALEQKEVSEPAESTKKPLKRLLWEWSHRLGGVTVLGLAWYNCYTGIDIQHEDFETKDWSSAFFGITAAISATVFVLAFGTRCRSS